MARTNAVGVRVRCPKRWFALLCSELSERVEAMASESGSPTKNIRRGALLVAQIVLLVAMIASVVATGVSAFRVYAIVSEWSALADERGASPRGRIGLVAGHWESDSGAVCPDGLTEAEVNREIAERAACILAQMGYEVEVLPEYADRLAGYQAEAIVSVHADSCIPGYSGFKVARASASAIPDVEDALVARLYDEYERETGLERDPHHVTPDMTGYHMFHSVAPTTPAAIIEVGYLGGDRRLLTHRPTRAARGIARGIIAFVEGSESP
jgi:N-acetylmuramoyl-L-alanine amidase